MRLRRVIILLVCSPVIILCVLFALSIPLIANGAGSRLMCQNQLKEMGRAIERYRSDHDGQYPPSLVEVGAYMEGKYAPAAGHAPRCLGDRGDDETLSPSDYVYRIPSRDGGIVPICWDSKPHRIKLIGMSDSFWWNILYSDGYVEHLSERKFRRELGDAPRALEGVE